MFRIMEDKRGDDWVVGVLVDFASYFVFFTFVFPSTGI